MAVINPSKTCLRKAKNQLEKHQMGFDGEHIGEVALRRLGYKGVRLTSHKSKFDILTSREAWEIKTVGRDALDKKMSVKAKQKVEKLAWAKKNRKRPKSMMVVVNDSAEVYVRDGLGKFRPGGMKKVRTFKDWRKEVGHGRTERLVEGKQLSEAKWIESLSTEESVAIKQYSSGSYGVIRDYQRTGKDFAGAKRYTRSIENALNRAKPYDGTVYRSLYNLDDKTFREIGLAKELEWDALSSSSILKKAGESRLSYGESGTKSVIFTIKNRTGVNIEKIVPPAFTAEREVLMRKGARYRVISTRKFVYTDPVDGTKYESLEIFLEEI